MRGLGGGGKRARRSADAAEAEALLQILPGAEKRTEWAGDLLEEGQLVHRICSLLTCFFYTGGGRGSGVEGAFMPIDLGPFRRGKWSGARQGL